MSATPIGALLRDKRIVVCCGAGGVGKTTTSAALALAAARMGRRVLVLTIDPSRRLAETLGVARNPPAPVPLPPERQKAAGIAAPGSLEAWMLDPKLVADEAVRRLVTDPTDAQRVLDNRIYQQVTSMVAGMHEYTAMESLHRLVSSGRYDLVVLDTPPSRNALDFLEAPGRLARLIDGRIFRMFLPKEPGLIGRAASKLIERVLGGVFGADFAGELLAFFQAFAGLFSTLTGDVTQMRAFLGRSDAAFLLVTSPSPATLDEAFFFRDKTRELGLPFEGFVLNKSRARSVGRPSPDESLLPPGAGAEGQRALEKLAALARVEESAAKTDAALLGELAHRAGAGAFAAAVPNLPTGADDLATLLAVAEALVG